MPSIKRVLFIVGALAVLLWLPWVGAEHLSWNEVFVPHSPSYRVLFEFRIPRLLVALLAGATLSMVGATYQVLFHNPLAEPYVLGVASAVTLGAVISEILQLGDARIGGSIGFLFAIGVSALLVWMSASFFAQSNLRVLLFGMGLNFVLSSVIFLLLSYAYQQMGGGSLRWLFGQLPWVEPREVVVLALLLLPGSLLLFLMARSLDALSLGDNVARTLGVAPTQVRATVLAITSFLTSCIVVNAGTIGFVGLVVPHAARLIFRPPSTRILFLHTLWMGGIFLCLCDAISRVLLPPFEFPVGMISTVLGGPLFLILLWKRK